MKALDRTRKQPPTTGWHQIDMPGYFGSSSKRFTIYALCTAAVLSALLLLGALSMANSNTAFFERYYTSLYSANILVTLVFLAIIAGLIGIIVRRLYQGKFGARLLTKLAVFFAIVGVLPGSILYLVSLQFVSRSIESWFDDNVDTALVSGLNLGQGLLDNTLADVRRKAESMATQLRTKYRSQEPLSLALSHLREQLGLYSTTLFSASGAVEAQAIESSFTSNTRPLIDHEHAKPSASMLRQASMSLTYAALESDSQPDTLSTGLHPVKSVQRSNLAQQRGALWVRVIVAIPPNYAASFEQKTSFLQVLHPIAPELAHYAQDVQQGYRNYQEKSLSRQGLRKMYIGTLTLALFLATFIAMLLAVILGNQLARPLFLLALGMQQVIRGDYTPKREINTHDELGFLTQAFNAMTRQLAEARMAVEQNRAALEDSHAYLENILQNLTAGVLVFDNQFHLTTANPGAERILQQNFQSAISLPFHTLPGLEKFSTIVQQAFANLKKHKPPKARKTHRAHSSSTQAQSPLSPPTHWQQQCEISLNQGNNPITLLIRGARLTRSKQACTPASTCASTAIHQANDKEKTNPAPLETTGYVVVFDDISDLISAQRSLAWGEVARRLAHEIKNPLTPIRLSIEQLDRKLAPKLEADDATSLRKGTQIILNQVDAMKKMVDDFRDYARTPPAMLQAVHLNDLVNEVSALYANEDYAGIFHFDLATLPAISADPAQLRQVMHNLIQNALDAVVQQPEPHIWIQTQYIEQTRIRDPLIQNTHSLTAEQPYVRLTISDNGPGFSAALLKRALEPYVTTKAKGTGLGLAVVKKIIDEHGALIDIQNHADTDHTERGAQISLTFIELEPV